MSSEEAVRRAARLLESGSMADAEARAHGHVEAAIPVEHPKGTLRSWFVAVTSADRLLGFFEFTPDLTPVRYSGFRKGTPAGAWLDPAAILRKAQRLRRPGEAGGDPYLSYDTYPARLAWVVPFTGDDGTERTVFVAGDAVYEGGSDPQSTG